MGCGGEERKKRGEIKEKREVTECLCAPSQHVM